MHHNIFIILPLEGSVDFLMFLLGDQILCLYNSDTLRQNFFRFLRKPVFSGQMGEVHLGAQVYVSL